jgi:hypothetical protein
MHARNCAPFDGAVRRTLAARRADSDAFVIVLPLCYSRIYFNYLFYPFIYINVFI